MAHNMLVQAHKSLNKDVDSEDMMAIDQLCTLHNLRPSNIIQNISLVAIRAYMKAK